MRVVRNAARVAALLLALTGCTYYGVPAAGPASVDRSFYAAADAMRDQGLTISVQDRSTGTVVGQLDSSTVTARVFQQADGSVQVRFDTSAAQDPALIHRISQSYDRRMGR